ncbi:MAG: SAM-dependent methyltransferase [Clostridia bacterium]|nr:SAM-dependent methyltransferase [Clostridia bacterium]
MNDRLESVFAAIPACNTFADVACDHGYIAEAMLKRGKCRMAFVSDISAKSLSKAEKLLAPFIKAGACKGFVSDGLDGVPKADCALIAGVGGLLITDILERTEKAGKLPQSLVVQPMKHCDAVRRAAVNAGYSVVKDFTVYADGQFYDIISLKFTGGGEMLSEEEIKFGRTNIKERPQAFRDKIKEKIIKLVSYAERENIAESTRRAMLDEAESLKKYV